MEHIRFQQPLQGGEVKSEYDIPSWELQDLISRAPDCVKVFRLNLTAGGTLAINEPAFGFCLYGFNTAGGAKYTDAFVNVAVNSDGSDPSKIFPAKTGRGYRGIFTSLSLTWPADTSSATLAAHFVLYKSRRTPWQGGEQAT